MNRLILILSIIIKSNSIWPPEYKVDLKDEEEFVISELLDRSDVQDIYDEEELIREQDLKTLNLHGKLNSEKYFRLHDLSKRENSMVNIERNYFKDSDQKLNQALPEFNSDLEEPKPWIAGFVDKNNNIVKDQETVYFDDEAKLNETKSENIKKRNAENDTVSSDYNYENLKAEYDNSVKKAESKNDTMKYKEVKEEETPEEAAKTLIDFKSHNCTEVEKTGIGLHAVRCFWKESRDKHLNKDKKFYMLKKVLLIAMLWIVVYVLIALPLWCQYGWCCCCFRCKFCHPRDEIEEIKTFFANNPPGIYHDEEGNLKKYKSTTYEIYAQKNLEKAIQRL